MSSDLESAAERLRIALDLQVAGIDMQRCRLRREHPAATPDEVERMLTEWLLSRPGDPPFREYVPRQGEPA
jgi:hypothetical protein